MKVRVNLNNGIMKATYNKSKIMRNAWYLKRVQPSKSFGECLRKAWRNEKQAIMIALAEGRTSEEPKATVYQPELLQIPADYYGVRGAYYGD